MRVIERLFALNAKRAEAERKAPMKAPATAVPKAKRAKAGTPSTQRVLLWWVTGRDGRRSKIGMGGTCALWN